MEYQVVYGLSADELEDVVVQEISEGWKPSGGLAVLPPDSGTARFVQAMTREPMLPVIAVQTLLEKYGFSPGKLDSELGPKTLAALNKLRATEKLWAVKEYERSSDALLRQLK